MKGTAQQAVGNSVLKVGEITKYQEQLGTSLDYLSRNVEVLAGRLSPVLSFKGGMVGGGADCPEEVLCPVADVLRRYLRIVESANSQLESMTEAIEL
jgi:hypothetical protein